MEIHVKIYFKLPFSEYVSEQIFGITDFFFQNRILIFEFSEILEYNNIF